MHIVARVKDNGARTKSRQSRSVPVSAELIRLYGDSLHTEYGDLDSDYVFVNLWGRPHGHPLTYAAVAPCVAGLAKWGCRGPFAMRFMPYGPVLCAVRVAGRGVGSIVAEVPSDQATDVRRVDHKVIGHVLDRCHG